MAGGFVGVATAVWAGPKPGKATAEPPALKLVVDETPVAKDGRLAGIPFAGGQEGGSSVVRVNVKPEGQVRVGPGAGEFRPSFGGSLARRTRDARGIRRRSRGARPQGLDPG